MEFVIVLVVLAVVVFVITAPLRRPHEETESVAPSSGLAELEAERDAKYREIRDADLDHRTGKLSDPDYEQLDRSLRAEAVEIMHAIDRAQPGHPDDATAGPNEASD